MKLTDLFKFKLFERKDTADLAVVNENFQTAESEIDKRLLKTAVQNTNTVTEAGYALDARQANPNVKGSLGDQIKSYHIPQELLLHPTMIHTWCLLQYRITEYVRFIHQRESIHQLKID